jgi:hypothetical protein
MSADGSHAAATAHATLTRPGAVYCAGALFRCYPGPWQVLRRAAYDPDVTQVVWQGDERPSLKTVALEILPGS